MYGTTRSIVIKVNNIDYESFLVLYYFSRRYYIHFIHIYSIYKLKHMYNNVNC